MKDLYSILGISKQATDKEVKDAYRKLARKYHPDTNQGDKTAEEKFKEVSEAYETLGNPQKRKMYDQFGVGGGGFKGGPNFSGFRGTGPRGTDPFPDLGDLFGDIFGMGGPASAGARARRPRPSKGSDLRYTLNISLEEAASGCEKIIYFMRIRGPQKKEAKLSVKVPRGVKPDQRLKLSGEGDKNSQNQTAGDLYVIIKYHKHPLFERVGDDLQIELPISFAEAIIGTTVKVPTLDGSVSLKIPEKTHANQVLRLRKKGFPSLKGDSLGDMLVKVIIDVPEKLSATQLKMIKEFDRDVDNYPLINEYKDKLKKLDRK